MGAMNETLSAALNLSGARPKLRDAQAVRAQIDAITRLAVFGSGYFAFHTLILDGFLWPALYK